MWQSIGITRGLVVGDYVSTNMVCASADVAVGELALWI